MSWQPRIDRYAVSLLRLGSPCSSRAAAKSLLEIQFGLLLNNSPFLLLLATINRLLLHTSLGQNLLCRFAANSHQSVRVLVQVTGSPAEAARCSHARTENGILTHFFVLVDKVLAAWTTFETSRHRRVVNQMRQRTFEHLQL